MAYGYWINSGFCQVNKKFFFEFCALYKGRRESLRQLEYMNIDLNEIDRQKIGAVRYG